MNPEAKLATARAIASGHAPYFAAEFLRLIPREAPWLNTPPTMAMSAGGVMYWHRAFVEKCTMNELAAVFVHEFLHHLFRDHENTGKRWNIAQDIRNNPMVRDMKLGLPADALYPATYKLPEGKSAAWYYDNLPRKPEIDDESSGGSVAGGRCGRCAGNHAPGEPPSDPDQRAEVEMSASRQRAAEAVHQWKRSKGQGSLPAGLDRWAEEFSKPAKVQWQDKLARFARSTMSSAAGISDYSFASPNRWAEACEFILPGMIAHEPAVDILIDTSGSMGADALGVALRETGGILEAVGTKPRVYVCDAAVHGRKRVRDVREVAGMLKGGGGSDFCPAFAEIMRASDRAKAVVAITDGFISVPAKQPPGLSVIWLLVGGSTHAPATWGHVIVVD